MKFLIVIALGLLPGLIIANESPKALQDAFLKALRSHDAAGIAACYAEDATNYPLDSMVGTGPDSVKESWAAFFEAFEVVDINLHDQHMQTREDLTAAWGLFKMTMKPIGGTEAIVMQGRYMDVSLYRDGKWLYIADHASVPFIAPESDQ